MKNKVEKYYSSKFKICLQREGHVLEIAHEILGKGLKTTIPFYDPKSRLFINLAKKGEIGIVYVKDRMVCDVVYSGFVDLGMIGSDRILEGSFKNKITILRTLNQISWPLVLAVPSTSGVKKISEIKVIATRYPKTMKKFLDSRRLARKVKIIKVEGSTEAIPYGEWLGKKIDAIADISITGRSLKNNSLVPLGKPIAIFHPIIIANKKSIAQKEKIGYFQNFYKNA